MNFLRKKFHSYYLRPSIKFPHRVERREFAFILFGEQGMHRHISFSSKDGLLNYLKRNIPAHAYYSSAYYRDPSAGTMQEKKWMGADLIFDLDADHLPNAKEMSYENSLQEVKKEAIKLLSFLIEDFGFSKKEIAIYFSGGRGYHLHVSNSKVIELGSQERREIVDYITGRGLNIYEIAKEKKIYKGKFTDKTVEIRPQAGGWEGRIARMLIEFFKKIKNMDKEKAIEELMKIEGVGNKMAEDIYNALNDERMKRIEKGKLDQATPFKKIVKPLIRKLAISLHSEADEPVTADIKRLIRLPGSLHGKTGLKVTEVRIDELEEFEPLRDAIVFSDEKVKIRMLKPFRIKMMEEEFDLKEGTASVPEYLAVFLVARKVAEA